MFNFKRRSLKVRSGKGVAQEVTVFSFPLSNYQTCPRSQQISQLRFNYPPNDPLPPTVLDWLGRLCNTFMPSTRGRGHYGWQYVDGLNITTHPWKQTSPHFISEAQDKSEVNENCGQLIDFLLRRSCWHGSLRSQTRNQPTAIARHGKRTGQRVCP